MRPAVLQGMKQGVGNKALLGTFWDKELGHPERSQEPSPCTGMRGDAPSLWTSRRIQYETNLCRWPQIVSPSRLILFGDGHSDVNGVWPRDRWWIWKEIGNANGAGFNRASPRGQRFRATCRKIQLHFCGRSGRTLLYAGRIPLQHQRMLVVSRSGPALNTLRMSARKPSIPKALLAIALLAVAGILAAVLPRHHGISEQAFFYDLSEKKLFIAEQGLVPPILRHQ